MSAPFPGKQEPEQTGSSTVRMSSAFLDKSRAGHKEVSSEEQAGGGPKALSDHAASPQSLGGFFPDSCPDDTDNHLDDLSDKVNTGLAADRT